MKRTFTASITQEGDWYVVQSLEVDVASQGETEEEALVNLGEALALHFTPPVATALPDLRPVEVEIGAAEAAAVPRSQAKAGGGGFTEISQRGSHVKFAKQTEQGLRTAVVPRHREVAAGTMRGILRQAGLNWDEFEGL